MKKLAITKFRGHAYALADAMGGVLEVESAEALAAHLGAASVYTEPYPDKRSGPVFDARIGWHTYAVMAKPKNGGKEWFAGFTNGPL